MFIIKSGYKIDLTCQTRVLDELDKSSIRNKWSLFQSLYLNYKSPWINRPVNNGPKW